MEIRDPVHGPIHILDEEIPIITDPFFQRLRGIKQLGFSDYIFPGATHSRFIHSIGVMHIGTRCFDKLFSNYLREKDFLRLRETLRLACLLHDIGHAPLSHSTETAMPNLSELKIPSRFLHRRDREQGRQATHEDFTIKALIDSNFSKSFHQVEDIFAIKRECIADLIIGKTIDSAYFTINDLNYFPMLHQLVSSELDCDRMDYLLRDSYFCGVSYGRFDLEWLIDNLEICPKRNMAYLGITEHAVVTFDDFLLSRYHMFIMVYFHYRSMAMEQLLYKFFSSGAEEYAIPADIEKYIEHDDHMLMKVLRKSKNPYAKSIVQNKIPAKIFESFNDKQKVTFIKLRRFLDLEKIDYIHCSSLGRLSKYYNPDGPEDISEENFDMKVVRKNLINNDKIYSNISECTDLFEKFSKSHEINRIHLDLEKITKEQKSTVIEIINS